MSNHKKQVSKSLSLTTTSVTEWLFRALIAVLIYMGNNLGTNQDVVISKLIAVERTISNMETADAYYKKEAEKIQNTISKAISKEEFQTGINPIISQLNENTKQINSATSILGNQNNRIIKLEITQENLLEEHQK
jgi:hypothetical protein